MLGRAGSQQKEAAPMPRFVSRLLCAAVVACALGASGAGVASASGPKHGYYQCYVTQRNVSPINGEVGFTTTFASSLTLRSGGHYDMFLRQSGRYKAYKSGRLTFRGGALDDNANFWHVGGRYYPHGKTMPHSTLANPKRHFAIVLRDLRSNDSDSAPAYKEFDMIRAGLSYWYCARR
jgi:hypothetical protein